MDGQQTSPDSSTCLDCPSGTAGTRGFCSLCAGGTEPNPGRTQCVACAPGFAGALGTCERCQVGEEPDAASALCVPCPPGRAGLNGTCGLCPVGTVQSLDRSLCVFCPEGEIATQARAEVSFLDKGGTMVETYLETYMRYIYIYDMKRLESLRSQVRTWLNDHPILVMLKSMITTNCRIIQLWPILKWYSCRNSALIASPGNVFLCLILYITLV